MHILGQFRAGAQPGEGADGAPRLMWQPSRWQKPLISAPDSMVTPGPKITFGPMIASRPIWVSSAKNTVSGAVRG
jgi:hypothetical protein